jgi:CHAT domain-containing protein/tetratricopeptide (TPR) repeat protein
LKIIIVWNKVFLVLMEQQNSQFKSYFLGTLDAEEADGVELQILEETEFAEMLELAENDLIEEYLDGGLSINDQKAFEQNYLISVSRRKKVEFLKAIKTFAKHQSKIINAPKPSFFETLKLKFSLRPPLLAFGTVALICAVSITSYFVWKNSTNKSEVLISLNKVYKNERPLDSRISDFDYAPKVEGTRGAKDKENEEFILTKSVASGEVLKNPTAESFHVLGQVYLTEKEFDKAIEQFEKAIKQNPNISKLHNDLGVALLEKGKSVKARCVENEKVKKECDDEKEPYLLFFAKANEQFAKGIELDKTSLEANFNQALCIQELNLPNQTQEAWKNYLKLDSTSKWANEARKNLEIIETQKPVSKTKEEILRDFLAAKNANDDEKAWEVYSTNREMSSGKLVPLQFAFLFIDSKAIKDELKAGEYIELLNYVAQLDKEKSDDKFWQDITKFNLNLSEGEILPLKNALDTMREAGVFWNTGKLNESVQKYKTAKTLLHNLKCVWLEKLCDYWIGSLKFRLNKLEESNNIFEELAKYSNINNYKWLATHSYVRLSYCADSQNNYSKSIEYSELALKLALQTNDAYNIQRIYTSLAYDYKVVGRYSLSLSYTTKSLILIKKTGANPTQLWEAFESLTFTLVDNKYFQTSKIIQKEALQIAERDNEFCKHLSELYLAMIYTEFNQYSQASEFLEESKSTVAKFEDNETKLKGLAFIDLESARLERNLGSIDKAIELYNSANYFYSDSEFKLNSYEANKGELLCYFLHDRDSEFRQKLPVVLGIFKNYRKQIIEEQNRNSFFDNEQDVYDIVAEYEFNKANFADAFDYTEESRSRSLLDLQHSAAELSTNEKEHEIKFSENFAEPLKLPQIQTEMPESTQLLVYSVLPEKVLIWSVTKEGLDAATSEISSENLNEKVTNYLESVSNNKEPEEQIRLSKELYQILISPVKDKLDADKQIVIIPDKSLFQLPFAALYTDKYLIEDYKISYSPSATVFLNCSRKAKEFGNKTSENILSVGNPAFNPNEYKNLKPLPSAKDEAIEIANLYTNPKVLVEEKATKEQVKENLKNADVFQFAGHYTIEDKMPLLSSFVLAGDKKDESNLANYEIIAEKLPHTRLIVLSACDTAVEKYYKGEGMIGASRTFLAVNVPLVVASQWQADSQSTKELMIRFHQFRKTDNLSTVEALRQSQLKMIKDERYKQPYYWAEFAALGGYTQF